MVQAIGKRQAISLGVETHGLISDHIGKKEVMENSSLASDDSSKGMSTEQSPIQAQPAFSVWA